MKSLMQYLFYSTEINIYVPWNIFAKVILNGLLITFGNNMLSKRAEMLIYTIQKPINLS